MMKLQQAYVYFRTLQKLGFSNVGKVAWYRVRLRAGWLKTQLPIGSSYSGPFFAQSMKRNPHAVPIQHLAFGHKTIAIPPKAGWHSNVLTGKVLQHDEAHWSEIPDFNSSVGDIKTVWEASRFDWLPTSLWQARNKNNLDACVTAVEAAVDDWIENNPWNKGPNWKCGQETSLRMLNLLLGLKISNSLEAPTQSSLRFVNEHLKRIFPTISYAVGQQNNHSISEGVALFVGGEFLKQHSLADRKFAAQCAVAGRKLLERSTNTLVMADGTFSQYSLIYHRMMLSLITLAELFRRGFALPAFSDLFYQNAQNACYWQYAFVDPSTGQVPNMGANDGANLFNIDQSTYNDFRPSTDAAFSVFHHFRVFGKSDLLSVFDIVSDLKSVETPGFEYFKDGGYITAALDKTRLYFRVPNYQFRPGQADALHLDIWHGHKNTAADSGTFSYADESLNAYFSGTPAHNTVQFDGRDQMPRLGRFLFAEWLRADAKILKNEPNQIAFSGTYTDSFGANHSRSISLTSEKVIVRDDISGFEKAAKLFWHLTPGNWVVEGNCAMSKGIVITIESPVDLTVKLMESLRSPAYLQSFNAPMIEVEVSKPTSITTQFEFLDR